MKNTPLQHKQVAQVKQIPPLQVGEWAERHGSQWGDTALAVCMCVQYVCAWLWMCSYVVVLGLF